MVEALALKTGPFPALKPIDSMRGRRILRVCRTFSAHFHVAKCSLGMLAFVVALLTKKVVLVLVLVCFFAARSLARRQAASRPLIPPKTWLPTIFNGLWFGHYDWKSFLRVHHGIYGPLFRANLPFSDGKELLWLCDPQVIREQVVPSRDFDFKVAFLDTIPRVWWPSLDLGVLRSEFETFREISAHHFAELKAPSLLASLPGNIHRVLKEYLQDRIEINLVEMINHVVFFGSVSSLIGRPTEDNNDLEALKDFQAFDQAFFLLKSGFQSSSVIAARRNVINYLGGSWQLTQSTQRFCDAVRQIHDNQGEALLLMTWAIYANSAPTAVWLLLHILKDPHLRSRIVEESRAAAAAEGQTKGPVLPSLSMAERAPLLKSVLQETLRKYSSNISFREVLVDRTLIVEDKEYHLRQGQVLMLENCHDNEAVFAGADQVPKSLTPVSSRAIFARAYVLIPRQDPENAHVSIRTWWRINMPWAILCTNGIGLSCPRCLVELPTRADATRSPPSVAKHDSRLSGLHGCCPL
jgi:hypothetical protein